MGCSGSKSSTEGVTDPVKTEEGKTNETPEADVAQNGSAAGAADSKPAATEAEAANDEAKKPSSEEDSNIKAIEEQGDDQEGGKVSAPSANEQTAGGTAAKGEPASAVEPEAPIVQTE